MNTVAFSKVPLNLLLILKLPFLIILVGFFFSILIGNIPSRYFETFIKMTVFSKTVFVFTIFTETKTDYDTADCMMKEWKSW